MARENLFRLPSGQRCGSVHSSQFNSATVSPLTAAVMWGPLQVTVIEFQSAERCGTFLGPTRSYHEPKSCLPVPISEATCTSKPVCTGSRGLLTRTNTPELHWV